MTGISWIDHEYSLAESGEAEQKKNPEALHYGWHWFSLLTPGAEGVELCITQVCPL